MDSNQVLLMNPSVLLIYLLKEVFLYQFLLLFFKKFVTEKESVLKYFMDIHYFWHIQYQLAYYNQKFLIVSYYLVF